MINNLSEIITLYESGMSSAELSAQFNRTPRHIQRLLKKAGKIRTISESFKLAIKRGRMKYYKKPEYLKVKRTGIPLKLRFFILKRDNFKCVLCGATAQDGTRIEIDHIDNNPKNNIESNLQVLCDKCNKGKAFMA